MHELEGATNVALAYSPKLSMNASMERTTVGSPGAASRALSASIINSSAAKLAARPRSRSAAWYQLASQRALLSRSNRCSTLPRNAERNSAAIRASSPAAFAKALSKLAE